MYQLDIEDFLGGPPRPPKGPRATNYRHRLRAIMVRFSEMQVPLSRCSDPQHLNKDVRTLKRYAREFGLAFPDYTPRALRKVQKVAA